MPIPRRVRRLLWLSRRYWAFSLEPRELMLLLLKVQGSLPSKGKDGNVCKTKISPWLKLWEMSALTLASDWSAWIRSIDVLILLTLNEDRGDFRRWDETPSHSALLSSTSPEAAQGTVSANVSLKNWAVEQFRICLVTSILDPQETRFLGCPYRHCSLERR